MIRGLKFTTKGSEYSGHHGHAGRPGSVGGSAPSFTHTDLGKVNKAFLQYFEEADNRYYTKTADINKGYCQEWAYIVSKEVGGELMFYDANSHAFVKYEGKFYDAQTRKGVEDWADLGGLREQRQGILNVRKRGVEKPPRKVIATDTNYSRGLKLEQVAAIMKLLEL